MPVKPVEIEAARKFFVRGIPRFGKALAKQHPELFVAMHRAVQEGKVTIKQLQTIGAHFISLLPEQQQLFHNVLAKAAAYGKTAGAKGAVQFLLTTVEKAKQAQLPRQHPKAAQPTKPREAATQTQRSTTEAEYAREWHYTKYVSLEDRKKLERYLPASLLAELKKAHAKEVLPPHYGYTQTGFDQPRYFTVYSRLADKIPEKPLEGKAHETWKSALDAILKRASEVKPIKQRVEYLQEKLGELQYAAGRFGHGPGFEQKITPVHLKEMARLRRIQANRLKKGHITPEQLGALIYEKSVELHRRPYVNLLKLSTGVVSVRFGKWENWRNPPAFHSFRDLVQDKLDPVHFKVETDQQIGRVSIEPRTREAADFLAKVGKPPWKQRWRIWREKLLRRQREKKQ